MKIFKCDLCGKELNEFDMQENFGLHYSKIGYGSKFDGKTIDIDMCCSCFDKMMDKYITPKIKKLKGTNGNKKLDYLENGWIYDMENCPLDTKIYLLSANDSPVLPQQVFVGTVTKDGSYKSVGECFQGDPDYFYRSKIIAWQFFYEDQ